jgi:hypothetical protein
MTKLTSDAADALLPQISRVETTLSSLGYYTGKSVNGRPESFDPDYLHRIDPLLNSLWSEMNDLCNAIAKALGSDGPSQKARVSEGAKNSLPEPHLEDL